MDKDFVHRDLIAQYEGYKSVLVERGIPYMDLSDEELEELSLNDLRHVVREVRDLARTPLR